MRCAGIPRNMVLHQRTIWLRTCLHRILHRHAYRSLVRMRKWRERQRGPDFPVLSWAAELRCCHQTLPGLYLKRRKKTFNGKWQASSDPPSSWAPENHAYSMDLIFIGKSQGWQRGSLNSFCVFALSSVVYHLRTWHHMHKNIVNFTLYLRTHVSPLW